MLNAVTNPVAQVGEDGTQLIRIRKSTWRALKVLCAVQGVSMTEFVDQCVTDGIQETGIQVIVGEKGE